MKHSLVLPLSFAVFAALSVALHLSGVSVIEENGLIENAQLTVLLLAVAVQGLGLAGLARRAGREDARALLAMGMVMISVPLAGTGREVNFGRMLGITPEAVDTAKLVYGVVVLLLILGGFGLWSVKVSRRWQRFRAFLAGPVCRPVYAAVAVFVLAGLLEKGKIGLPPSMLLEELAELATFLLILEFALRFAQAAADTAVPPKTLRYGAVAWIYAAAVAALVFLAV